MSVKALAQIIFEVMRMLFNTLFSSYFSLL